MDDPELIELLKTVQYDLLAVPTNHAEEILEISGKITALLEKLNAWNEDD